MIDCMRLVHPDKPRHDRQRIIQIRLHLQPPGAARGGRIHFQLAREAHEVPPQPLRHLENVGGHPIG